MPGLLALRRVAFITQNPMKVKSCVCISVFDERQPDFKALCRKAVSAFVVIAFGFFLCVDFGQDAVDFFRVAVDAVASV